MHPIAAYLEEAQQVHASGSAVKETSYYPALSALFNAIGKPQKPPVYCVSILKNVGGGYPDGGFFTKTQNQVLEKEADPSKKKSLLQSTKPERGVLEVKGADHDLDALIQSDQVHKYLQTYGLVLATNLRQFALVDLGPAGKAREVERFELCDDAEKFWHLSPAQVAQSKGEECLEFLGRCLLRGAPLRSPQDVAAYLASYARQARLRLEATDLDVLEPLKKALEAALGIEFKAVDKPGRKLSEEQKREQGERFFRATLVQTLFYGLFSAWLSHVKQSPAEPFRWREAQYSLHVPMVSTLFEELIKRSNLRSLELEKLIALATETLNRVEAEAFLASWGDAGAVQYFYEPFLERFDPQLRRELGVYYTPPEIVRYMVQRVHRVLIDELHIEGGLANESVMILDPCCGTGAYVTQTLQVIGDTLRDTRPANRVAGELKAAAMQRVFGFEILPAPFVVAHHGVADKLKSFGATLKEGERAPVYLTNALTGWASEPDATLPYEGFQQERDLARKVKQQDKILVIIGNPPYDAFARIEEDGDLVAPYKKGLRDVWKIKKWSFNDLYLRFFRIAERKLTQEGQGVLCFISNFSYLREPSFVVMRQHLLQSFDGFWIDVLNGDSRETGKRTPGGEPDPSIFSTPFNREGIKVGTAIGLMVRGADVEKKGRSRELWGDSKRQDLLASLNAEDFNAQYQEARPTPENRFALRPRNPNAEYEAWAPLPALCESPPLNGLMEKRGGALMAFDQSTLRGRMEAYFDPALALDDLAKFHRGLASPAARFDPALARKNVSEREGFRAENLLPYVIRPFDLRWCYYTGVRPLWNEPRPALRAQLWDGNSFLVSRPKGQANPEGVPTWFASTLGDNDAIRGHAYYFPFFLRRQVLEALEINESGGSMEPKTRTETVANLSPDARKYLSDLGLPDPDADGETAALLWRHALAIGYSLRYRQEHAGGLASDWPRVPLPSDAPTLRESARLGEAVAALLDVARPVAGIESGKFRHELEPFGMLARRDQMPIEDGDEALRLSENWGFFGERNIVQPGSARPLERAASEEEKAALQKLGVPESTRMLDVPLNQDARWHGVPRPVWEMVIGGYPVLKKWLSYRDERVLGRALRLDEAQQVENMVRRLALLWALSAQLDASYHACAASARPLATSSDDAAGQEES